MIDNDDDQQLVSRIKTEIALGFDAGRKHLVRVGVFLNEARMHWDSDDAQVDGLTFREWVQKHVVDPDTKEPLDWQIVQWCMVEGAIHTARRQRERDRREQRRRQAVAP